MMWVYDVGITTIYCGKHMLWTYTVEDTVYPVGHTKCIYTVGGMLWTNGYIMWTTPYMMWVTWSSTVYINMTHNI